MKRFFLIIACVTLPSAGGAQQVREVTDDGACATCRIVLTHLTSLGDRDGPGSLSAGPQSLARDSRGFFYLTDYQEGGRVFVFDSEGTFVRSVGKEGSGPGEFSRVTHVGVTRGDTLRVVDPGNSRLTVYSPEGAVAGTRRLGAIPDRLVVVDDTLVVFNGIDEADLRTGRDPVQVYSLQGDRLESFGYDPSRDLDRPVASTRPFERWRTLGTASQGVWLARPNAYRLERWSVDGNTLAVLERDVPWFPPWRVRVPFGPLEPPLTTLVALREVAPGLLWTVVEVAAENWREGIGAAREQRGRTSYEVDIDKLYDAQIEVIDIASATVVASTRVEANIEGFLGDGLVYSVRHDVLGIPYVDVWEVEIQR